MCVVMYTFNVMHSTFINRRCICFNDGLTTTLLPGGGTANGSVLASPSLPCRPSPCRSPPCRFWRSIIDWRLASLFSDCAAASFTASAPISKYPLEPPPRCRRGRGGSVCGRCSRGHDV